MSANKTAPVGTSIPTIKRRLISMVYEVLLAFAVLFLPFLVFEMISGASHAPLVEHLRQALAFLILGAYFIHQWSRKGQTLAMQTWRLKVVLPGHANVPLKVATLRYLASWMWVLPALLLDYALGLEKWHALYALFGGVLLWSLTAFLDKDRQFLHDKIAGTRLVQLPKPEKKKAKAAAAKA